MPLERLECYGCGEIFKHKTGLSNHRRACEKWKNFDGVAAYKRRRLKKQTRKANLETPHDLGTLEDDRAQTFRSPSPIPPPPQTATRSGRSVRFPRRFDDYLPVTRTPLAHIPSKENQNPPQAIAPLPGSLGISSPAATGIDENCGSQANDDVSAHNGPDPFTTVADTFGIYRVYSRKPVQCGSSDTDCGDAHSHAVPDRQPGSAPGIGPPHPDIQSTPYFHPFSNPSAAAMMVSYHSGAPVQSLRQTNHIAHILGGLGSDLDALDLSSFDAAVENRKLDAYLASVPETTFQREDGWLESSVRIRLPLDKKKMLETEAAEFEVEGLFYRDIIDVITSVYQSDAVKSFNNIPFKEFWRPSQDSPPERLYGEIYSSQAMLDIDDEICKYCLGKDSDSQDIEAVSVPIMLYSDSTHLANFGNASSWPVYMFFGSQSKYIRAMPTSDACHHIAYMPKLPDTVQDFYRQHYKTSATAATLTHCKRDLMHAIFSVILNDRFVDAYRHGFVIECGDSRRRRLFPRIVMYSADYPEKVLLSTIKSNAEHPCPRCLVKKVDTIKMGMQVDIRSRHANIRIDDHVRQSKVDCARRNVFEEGIPLSSKRLKDILGKFSGVPTHNIFSTKLSGYGLDYHKLFAVDLLHEFELGVWKAIFTHLMRILQAIGGNSVQDLNNRYRQVPTFGKAIRRFSGNPAAMRKLAARDFEDLLQCALPVFEGLLRTQRENTLLRTLLFHLAMWHAFAKLRLHTDTTLNDFKTLTSTLGLSVRMFIKEVCSQYDTTELPDEMAARGRREAALAKKSATPGASQRRPTSLRAHKQLNLSTYKYHALGDYPDLIAYFGTTDNASTQTGELQHKMIKRRFARTNKRRYTSQLTTAEVRERCMRRIAQRMAARARLLQIREHRKRPQKRTHTESGEEDEGSPDTATRYVMSETTREWENILESTHTNRADIAMKDFIPRLKDHLITRLHGKEYDGDEQEYTHAQRNDVMIRDNRIHLHRTLRVNYTSYDLQRQHDVINPVSHPDIMVLSCEDGEDVHPFWYARVVKIFHVYVRGSAPNAENEPMEPQRMDVLWVRWFGLDTDSQGGWSKKRLHSISFIPWDEPAAFGFLDPTQVIRGVHLIPNFPRGRTGSRLPPSIARPVDDCDEDWEAFYVNFFVDRDMFMRYRGGGVGHIGTRFLDSRMKVGNNNSSDEQQEEETIAGMDEDGDSYMQEVRGDDAEQDSGTHEEWISRSNEVDEYGEGEGEGEEEDADEDAEDRQEMQGNLDDGKDLEDEDGEALDDDEILDEEEFAEL